MNNFSLKLKRITNSYSYVPTEEDFDELGALQKELLEESKAVILKNPEVVKNHLKLAINEIMNFDSYFEDRIRRENKILDEITSDYKKIGKSELAKIDILEQNRYWLCEVLYIMNDTTAYLLEMLFGYFPDLLKFEENWKAAEKYLQKNHSVLREIERKKLQRLESTPAINKEKKAEPSRKTHTIPSNRGENEASKEHNKRINYEISFASNAIPEIFNILKRNFREEQHSELKTLLEEGKNSTSPLIYRRPANSLCDFFKQLLIGQFITVSVQADLEKWISANFKYFNKASKEIQEITAKYAERFISGTARPAKGKRLIDIMKENGENIIVQNKILARQKND